MDVLNTGIVRPVFPPKRSPAWFAILAAHRGRFAANLLSNLAYFALSILVGLWMTPFLIRHLGVAAYGLIPLAINLTSYVGLVTTALNSTVGRFVTVNLEQSNHAEANRVFNTAFWGTIIVVAVLIGPAIWMSGRLRLFLQVPAGFDRQFALLFLCTVGMFFITTLTTPFGVAAYSRNRFDLSNAVNIAGTLARAAAILLLFTVCRPAVWHVGLAMLVASGVVAVLSVIIWRRLTPTLRIRRDAFSWRVLRQLTGMGGWIVVNQLGTLLFLSVELVAVNRMCGADASGRYGALLLWPATLRGLAGVVAGVFGPTILLLHSRGDSEGLVSYSRQAVKLVGLAAALPIGLVCGLGGPLLRTWLGSSFGPLGWLLAIMCFHLSVNLAVLPLFNIQVATKDVRLPGIVTCAAGIANLGLALFLAGPAGWGMYGVAAAGAIVLTLKNLVFTPLYAAHILQRPLQTFVWQIVPIVIMTAVVALMGRTIAAAVDVTGYVRLSLVGAILSVGYAVAVYRYVLTAAERRQLDAYLPSYFNSGTGTEVS